MLDIPKATHTQQMPIARRINSKITSQFIDEIAEHLPEDAAN